MAQKGPWIGPQVVVVIISGSVAPLTDTVHNFSDAGLRRPLWVSFVIGDTAEAKSKRQGGANSG